jgi:hypothetical protein
MGTTNMLTKNHTPQDRTLLCSDCDTPFIFTAGEQQFFADKGYATPKRCHPCRQDRRRERERQ